MTENEKNQAGNTANPEPSQMGTNEAGGEKQKITFTPEQKEHIDQLINAQYAKVMAKADKKLEAIKEAEKLKNMSEEERTKAELETAHRKIAEYEKQQFIAYFSLGYNRKNWI